MLDTIPVPADSKFGAMIARRLNASRSISPVGSLAMSGPTGTGFAPLPSNLRDRRGSTVRPWTFAAHEDEDGERVGGWRNQIVQVGYQVYNKPGPDGGFKDETGHEDGRYFLRIDISKPSSSEDFITIIRQGEDDDEPVSDLPNGIIVVWIGTVEDCKQTFGIYWPPVIYTYQ